MSVRTKTAAEQTETRAEFAARAAADAIELSQGRQVDEWWMLDVIYALYGVELTIDEVEAAILRAVEDGLITFESPYIPYSQRVAEMDEEDGEEEDEEDAGTPRRRRRGLLENMFALDSSASELDWFGG